MAYVGDAIRLTITFRDFDDNPAAATSPALQLYAYDQTPIGASVDLVPFATANPGEYVYHLIVPQVAKGNFVAVEIKGIVGGQPELIRKVIPVEWA